jgi:hypothetical protein
MEGQWGVPEREMETTDQPRWVAARQMRDPGVDISYESQRMRGWGASSSLCGGNSGEFRTEKPVSAADYELLLCCGGHYCVVWSCN